MVMIPSLTSIRFKRALIKPREIEEHRTGVNNSKLFSPQVRTKCYNSISAQITSTEIENMAVGKYERSEKHKLPLQKKKKKKKKWVRNHSNQL
ncbi:unnamed protein product [Cuscuta campestris]|uniref:Uncharacterized protein n=1 Tax=Cuscuta campestris TaxID=132261 RepID=A0A484MGY1_9ASTE|nr:unnamed protein product [Cuscuta campestris]